MPSNLISQIASQPKIPVLDMVLEAVSAVGVARKGASYIAIRKYVLEKYSNLEDQRMKTSIKKAVMKAVEKGILKRPNASKDKEGAVGHFLLSENKPKKKKINVTRVGKKEKNKGSATHVSDSEVTINKGNKMKKLNLSDTELEDIRKLKTKAKPKLAVEKQKAEGLIKKTMKEGKAPTQKKLFGKIPTQKAAKGKDLKEKEPEIVKTIAGPSGTIPKKKTVVKKTLPPKPVKKTLQKDNAKPQPKKARKNTEKKEK